MTLQQLRLAVGDHDFFRILKRWARSQAGGNVSTDEFIRLAEKISGQDLDDLFDTWLFTPTKPVLPAAALRTLGIARHNAPADARGLLQRYGQDLVARLTK
jgi:aminopeptidase N